MIGIGSTQKVGGGAYIQGTLKSKTGQLCALQRLTLAHKFVKVGETSYLLPVHISMLSELLLIT